MSRAVVAVVVAVVLLVLVAAVVVRAQEHGRHSPPPEGHREGLHHDFSDIDEWVRRFESPDRDGWQRPGEVVTLMGVAPGMTVVDLGAGTGYFLPHLAAAVGDAGRVVGLDVEPAMVGYMNERATRDGLANVSARQVPYDDPELAEASVDRVLIVNTWHHVDDRADYAARLLRGLKPGGAVVVVDYTLDAPRGPAREHRLTPEQVAAELAAGGLEATVAEEDLPYQYVVVGRRPTP